MTDETSVVSTVEVDDKFPALRQMVRTFNVTSLFVDPDGDEFVMGLMEKILTADSVDDIFAAQDSGMVAGKDFALRPFFLRAEDIDIKKSAEAYSTQGGFTHYAMLKVREITTGEEVTLNCGGKTFMAVLHALRLRGYFDDDKYPEGRALVIIAVPSPAGAYLQLKPYKQPAPPHAAKKKS